MSGADRVSSLFWLLFASAVFIESYRLGTGTLHNPGMGFMAFGASGLLAILSVILFVQAILKKERGAQKHIFAGIAWKRILFVILALVAYTKLMPAAGFLIATFLLLGLLFWLLEQKKIWQALLLSLLTSFISYILFSKWLNCQFPTGLFGF